MATIYSLALHEELELDRYNTVKRVPGGWLYRSFIGTEKDNYSAVGVEFVPYNSEYVPALNLTPNPLELGTYDYGTTSYTATNPGTFQINYSGEHAFPLELTLTGVNTGDLDEWEFRKIGDATWTNADGNTLSYSTTELDAGGGSIDVECRRLLSNHGAASSVLYEGTFQLSGDNGSIIDTAVARCTVIGTITGIPDGLPAGR